MPTEVLSPVLRQKFFANSGIPLNGGKLFSYTAGTTTKRSTFTDAAGAGTNTNPVILDFRGEADVWIPPNVGYKFVLAPANDTDPPTNPIWTIDNVTNSQLLTLYGGVDTGVANAYVLTFVANFTAYTDGITIIWIPANTNTGPSTMNVNGLGPVNILNANGSALSTGQLQANTPVTILYRGGSFTLVSPPTGIPVRVYKTAATARASTTTATADPHLLVTGGSGTFAVEALLLFNESTTGVGGIKIGFYALGAAGLVVNPEMLISGTVNATAFTGKGTWNVSPAVTPITAATVAVVGNNDILHFRGVIVGSNAGAFGISWAQNSSNVNATNMLIGSWMQVTQLS